MRRTEWILTGSKEAWSKKNTGPCETIVGFLHSLQLFEDIQSSCQKVTADVKQRCGE